MGLRAFPPASRRSPQWTALNSRMKNGASSSGSVSERYKHALSFTHSLFPLGAIVTPGITYIKALDEYTRARVEYLLCAAEWSAKVIENSNRPRDRAADSFLSTALLLLLLSARFSPRATLRTARERKTGKTSIAARPGDRCPAAVSESCRIERLSSVPPGNGQGSENSLPVSTARLVRPTSKHRVHLVRKINLLFFSERGSSLMSWFFYCALLQFLFRIPESFSPPITNR